MTGRTEFRALAGVVGAVAAVGVGSSLAGIADHIAAAVLAVAALVWLAVLLLGRERRIRARLADPRTHRPAQPSATTADPADRTTSRPGPAAPPDAVPVALPVAVSARSTHRAPAVGRADRTGGAR